MPKAKTKAQPKFAGNTHIAVILDKSGSMGVVRKETIGGFNAWLKSMQEDPDPADLTLTLFDTTFSTPVKASPLAKVNPLDESRYMPSGNTALLDAVGTTLDELGLGISTDRYIACIMTDGEENASHRFTKEDIQAKIAEREKQGNWTFTYLSAGMDAFADAASIGVAYGNTQSYTADAYGTQAAFMSNAANTKSFRGSAVPMSRNFYQGQDAADPRGKTLPNPIGPVVGGFTPTQRPAVPQTTTWTTDDTAKDSAWVSE